MKDQPFTSPLPLVARGMSKSFGDRSLWNGIGFRVEPGEMVAITGQSGSGKTTLLNCIGLLEPLDTGSLRIGDRPLRFNRARARREFYRHGVGFLFQNYGLVESWTVLANLNLSLTYSRLTKIKQHEARETALNSLQIEGLVNRRVFTLSGGEQQRVALARLMLQGPSVVLADEPTAALDDSNADNVIRHLATFRDRDAIVFVSTHDSRVIEACDRRIRLPGVTANSTPAETLDSTMSLS